MKIKNIAVGMLVLGFMVPSFSFAAGNPFCDQLTKSGTNTEIKKSDKNFANAKTKVGKDLARDEKLAKNKSVSDAVKIKALANKESIALSKLPKEIANTKIKAEMDIVATYNASVAKLITAQLDSITVAVKDFDDTLSKIFTDRQTEMSTALDAYKKSLADALAQAKSDCADKTLAAGAKATYDASVADAVNMFNSDFVKITKSFVNSINTAKSTRDAAIIKAGDTFKADLAKARSTLEDSWPLKIVKLFPADNEKNVSTTTKFVITFNKVVYGGKGAIEISNINQYKGIDTRKFTGDNLGEKDGSDGSGGSGTKTITMVGNGIPSNTDFYVLIQPSAFTDSAKNQFKGISDPTVWNFKTK